MKGRVIIKVQNIAISAMLTDLLVRFVFADMRGVRLVIVIVAAFVLFFRTLEDVVDELLTRGKHDKERGGKSTRGSVPGKPWYKMRYRDIEQKDRDTANYLKTVSEKPGQHTMWQVN